MAKIIARQKTKESVALATFFNIAEKWQLSIAEQMILLGIANPSTLHNYKRDPLSARVDRDLLDRLSYLLGIFQDLQVLLSNEKSADSWVKAPNTASPFNGKTALELMCGGSIIDLLQVRQYLAAQRGV
jgi:hypothetical protein